MDNSVRVSLLPSYMNRQLLGLIVLTLWLLNSACVSHRKMILLHDPTLKRNPGQVRSIDQAMPPSPYKVRTKDQLYIKVTGYEEENKSFRLLINGETERLIADGNDPTIAFSSYPVNDSGYIELPVIGRLQVVGQTLASVRRMIRKELGQYLRNADAKVFLASFHVTMLGELKRPGVQYVYDENMTILDAIAMAGGTTEYGDLTEVKLMTQRDGYTETVYLDLSQPTLPTSRFYYLYPDDVIYVEPVKAKATRINAQNGGIILSTISVLAVVGNLLVNYYRNR